MGDLFGNLSIWTILLSALGFVFQIWPFILLSGLQQRHVKIGSFIGIWIALAIIRVIILFDAQPMWDKLVWSDPIRTSLFFLVGLMLSGLVILRRVLHR